MIRSSVVVFALSGVTVLSMAACSVADIGGGGAAERAAPTAPTREATTGGCGASSAGGAAPGGGGGLTPQDPATMPKCACKNGGAARCVPKAKLPAQLATQLEACTEGGGGACVPDTIVKSGGAAPPKCTSPFGEGRCMSLCVPEVGANAKLLDRGTGNTCAEDERCAPCNNPLKNNEPTGVCDIGATTAPAAPAPTCDGKTDAGASQGPPPAAPPKPLPVGLKDCCKVQGTFRGKCVPKAAVPPAALPMLGNDEAQTCSAATEVCAPSENLDSAFKPAACKADSFVIGPYAGVCLSDCVDFGLQGIALDQGNCSEVHTCVPCVQGGKPTGAPGCPNTK